MPEKLKIGVVATVPVSELKADPQQPRKTFPEAAISSLAESLKVRCEVPLIVRYEGKQLVIVDGERRLRAAKLAKLKTLPCMLRGDTGSLGDRAEQLDIAATQLTTAVQRENLSALDIAEFILDLRKRQKYSINQVLADLAQRGIKAVGPAKLERLVKLTELPDWAKAWMRDGTLGETHGQVLLSAVTFPKVMNHAKAEIAKTVKWKGEVTAHEIREDIEQGFRQYGTDLNRTYGDEKDQRHFPIEVCKACACYKKIGRGEYCMDRGQFDKKNAEALLIKAEREARKAQRAQEKKTPAGGAPETDPTKVEPRKLKATEDNVVILKRMPQEQRERLADGDFDKEQCQTCPHMRMASSDGGADGAEAHCFHPPCFAEKTRLNARHQSRKGKMREYLEHWLRPIVARVAPRLLEENATYGLVIWLATGAIDRRSKYYSGQRHDHAARATLPFLVRHELATLPQIVALAETQLVNSHWHELVGAAVQVMTREQLRWFAHYLKIELEAPGIAYLVDEAYLKMKRKSELQLLLRDALAGTDTAAVNLGEFGVEGLRDLATAQREAIGVPADLRALYLEPFDAPREDDEDFDLLAEGESVCIGCGCTHTDPCEEGCGWLVQGEAVGVCTSCRDELKRWERGDRALTAAADARVRERAEFRHGVEQDDDAALTAAVEEVVDQTVQHVTGGKRKGRRKEAA